MKKIGIHVLLLNVCLSILQSAVGFAGFHRKDPEPPPRAVNITVDSRIELLAVVQLLSGYDKRYRLITRFDFPYKQDVRESFSTYKNHSAVKLFVRAVTTRLADRKIDSKAGEQAFSREKERGFAYVQALCESLAGYEEQRDTYPMLVDFYPELIRVFQGLIEKDPGRDFYSVPFTGTYLRFISAWSHPRNPEKGMVFYTAQRPEDVLNINNAFHGPTNSVIAKAREPLVSANDDKQNGTWSLTTVIDTGTETERIK